MRYHRRIALKSKDWSAYLVNRLGTTTVSRNPSGSTVAPRSGIRKRFQKFFPLFVQHLVTRVTVWISGTHTRHPIVVTRSFHNIFHILHFDPLIQCRLWRCCATRQIKTEMYHGYIYIVWCNIEYVHFSSIPFVVLTDHLPVYLTSEH